MTGHQSLSFVRTLCAGFALIGMLGLSAPDAGAQQIFHHPKSLPRLRIATVVSS